MSFSLKELYESAEERITNPFVGSFILSFLAINWEITFTLFFGDDSYYQQVYAGSKYLFLKKQFETANYIVPLLIAIIFPLVKLLLNLLVVYFSTLANEYELKILKDKGISTNLYFDLRDKYLEKIEEAQKLVANEKHIQSENDRMRESVDLYVGNLKKLEESKNEMQQQFDKLHDVTMINGDYVLDVETSIQKKFIKFESGMLVETDAYDFKTEYYIENFCYNKKQGVVTFNKFKKDLDKTMRYQNLISCRYSIFENGLEGHENGVKVKYNRR